MSKFSQVAQVRMNRSKFDLSKGVKTSMSVGRLYPLDIQEILPGDTFKNKTQCVVRLSTNFLRPVMDNAYMDVYHFFVPYRLLYKDSERVFGNPNPSAYVDNDLAEFPHFETQQTVTSNTVADYLGLPLGTIPKGVSVLPFRAFAMVWNQWFRNENTVAETYIQDGELADSEALNNNDWSPNNYTGKLPFVGKKKDYFTSALPQPQKGAQVELSLGDKAPVYYKGSADGLKMNVGGTTFQARLRADKGFGSTLPNNGNAEISLYQGNFPPTSTSTNGVSGGLTITNGQFYADLSSASAISINDQRFAFQLQRMLERDALYGSRYNEYLLGHFGVTSPDSRLQITEFLGGGRIPITVQQVAQTTGYSSSASSNNLGNVGAFSLSNGFSRYTKSFVEHGYVITVGCIRTIHTYQQGINKMWSRTSRNDFYDPLFATLGEQPIYTSELYASGQELKGDIFGYNEAWADYRYSPSRVSGQMRSTAGSNKLDVWHFGDNYANAPILRDTFTNETSTFFDRTIKSPSTSIDNFICDFWFDTQAVRVMPLYSVPGLIDHH